MTRPFSLIALITTASVLRASLQEPTPQQKRPCRETPNLVGPCFTVHGALRFYNGGTPFHIWITGTTRMLGVGAPSPRADYCELPQWLERQVRPDTEVIAEFVVCPFTRDRPGVERRVCVDTAYNVRVQTRSR
jgi:hypothetical protein